MLLYKLLRGSNSSIPDLLARQKSQAISRPSSASKLPPRSRPDSAGKCRRPQSAKDTLSEKKENVSASKDLGSEFNVIRRHIRGY